MKIFSATSAVVAAEQRLEQSTQHLRQQLNQVGPALKQSALLLTITGIGALLGIRLARRNTAAATSGGASVWLPVRGLLLALLIRYIAQRLAKRVRNE